MSSENNGTQQAGSPPEPPETGKVPAKRFSVNRLKLWFKEKSGGYKLAILLLALVSVVGAGATAFYSYDYTENNPKFCVSCHLMKTAFDKWEASPHNKVNCHTCHYATVFEKNMMLVKYVLFRPTEVEPRHGKLIVPRDVCASCHWSPEGNGSKLKINRSPLHAKHVFTERIQCTKCHGTELHQFIPEPRFCVKCHQNKEVHGVGMEGLACLNCHINQGGKEIKPDRAKCLSCHENIKLHAVFPKEGKGVMQFNCSTCHHPHKNIKPTPEECLKCHSAAAQFTTHKKHIEIAQKDCETCHKPHKWKIDEADSKQICAKCHEYRPLAAFF